jgi:hypothetical protein
MKFTHDCDRCKFLGTHSGQDLYFCKGNIENTILARYGDRGDQYSSIDFSTPTSREELIEAKRLVVELKLM